MLNAGGMCALAAAHFEVGRCTAVSVPRWVPWRHCAQLGTSPRTKHQAVLIWTVKGRSFADQALLLQQTIQRLQMANAVITDV
jgi:hypothetical protein